MLAGCSKDEILNHYNNIVQSAGSIELTGKSSLQGEKEKGIDDYMPTKLLCFVFSLICEYSCLFILHQLQAKVSFVSIILLIISTGVIVVLAPCNNAEIHCSSLELQSIKKSVHRRLALYSLLIAIFIVLKPILANTLIIAEFAVAVLVALSRLGVGIQ